ncbi:MAG: PH domain-containing protein [Bacteroidia bacterium]|nr:PH domain-containing protein [Bacteroidia bacterium]
MSFDNPQLDVSNLPDYRSSSYMGIDTKYLTVMRWGAIVFAFVILIPPITVITAVDQWSNLLLTGPIFGAWILIFVTNLILVKPRFLQKCYSVRERDISYKTGLLNRTTTTIPFNRVQHCDIKQGIISRYFGLSKLNVYTAGGSRSDLSIPGLRPAVANKIMNYVLQKTLEYDEEE